MLARILNLTRFCTSPQHISTHVSVHRNVLRRIWNLTRLYMFVHHFQHVFKRVFVRAQLLITRSWLLRQLSNFVEQHMSCYHPNSCAPFMIVGSIRISHKLYLPPSQTDSVKLLPSPGLTWFKDSTEFTTSMITQDYCDITRHGSNHLSIIIPPLQCTTCS